MFLQGKGVPKDTSKALTYFTQAADQGWVDGQLQLGNMYFSMLFFLIDYDYFTIKINFYRWNRCQTRF